MSVNLRIQHQHKRINFARRYKESENIYREKRSQLKQMKKWVWMIPVIIGILVLTIWRIEIAIITSVISAFFCYTLYSRRKWGIEREWNDVYEKFFQESIDIDKEHGISPYPK
jgi:hypothetical protein